jgi:CIC family chloride channel protein
MGINKALQHIDKAWSSLMESLFDIFERLNIGHSTILLGLAFIVGIGGGYGQLAFHNLIHLFQTIAIGPGDDVIGLLSNKSPIYLILMAGIGGIAVGLLITYFAPEAKGHGVPTVMEAVALRGGKIRSRVMIVKTLASAITLSTGGAVGREGPIVQIGSALGSTVGQVFKVSRYHMRVLVACGAAAGIAATFNAPMAGVLFSAEVILGELAMTSFSPLVVSAVIATIISHAYLGDSPIFTIPIYSLTSSYEIALYMVLGLLGALVALLYSSLVYLSEDFFDGINIPLTVKCGLGMALVGCFLVYFPHVFGGGYQAISQALTGEMSFKLLIILFIINNLASSLTLGAGGSGGVFAPALFVGAMFGGVFGNIVHSWFPTITSGPGAYAVVGMGCVVAAATRAPIAAILIIFEMTGEYHIILPLMFAIIISSVFGSWLSKDSIYTKKLRRKGINLQGGLETHILNATPASEIMHTEISTLNETHSFTEVLNRILGRKDYYHYVVDKDEHLIGVISLDDIKGIMGEYCPDTLIIATDMMNPPPQGVYSSTSLTECIRRFGARNVEELPVFAEDATQRILGVIRRQDIMGLYSREVLFHGTMGLKLVTQPNGAMKNSYVDIQDGHQVVTLKAKGSIIGKTLKDLDLRNKFGVNVVAIKSGGGLRGEAEDVPDPTRPFKYSDILILVGPEEKIARFQDEMLS